MYVQCTLCALHVYITATDSDTESAEVNMVQIDPPSVEATSSDNTKEESPSMEHEEPSEEAQPETGQTEVDGSIKSEEQTSVDNDNEEQEKQEQVQYITLYDTSHIPYLYMSFVYVSLCVPPYM